MYSAYNRNRPRNPITYNKNSPEVPHRRCTLAEGTAEASDYKQPILTNVVQPPPKKKAHGATFDQARLPCTGLDLFADAPRRSAPALVPTLYGAEKVKSRGKYRLCSPFPPPLTGTGCCCLHPRSPNDAPYIGEINR
ncbi:hypothetical protein GOODEAATRI_010620 [Goodea atripinnis]|uniref:Uncharacterized protein n=1 Tax=Goodea atripinnis TaxID=208336 RepID=A0ABV0NJ51_9TELE